MEKKTETVYLSRTPTWVTWSGEPGALRVLFVGNSITRHRPKPEIGWTSDWGMAASAPEKDFVHLLVRELEQANGPVDWCIAQVAEWERRYAEGAAVLERYRPAREFNADLVIVRMGENIRDEDHARLDCRTAAGELIRFLSPKPGACVIVTDTFCRRKAPSLEESLKGAAADCGAVFCSLDGLAEEDTMDLKQFGRHPNDRGMQRIADRIFEAIPERYRKGRSVC